MSCKVPPNCLAQTKFPDPSNFEIKTSSLPAEVIVNVPAPGSKSAVALKQPVEYTLEELSIAIEKQPDMLPDPPNCLAQIKFPAASNFKTKESTPPIDVSVEVPTPGSKSTVPLK